MASELTGYDGSVTTWSSNHGGSTQATLFYSWQLRADHAAVEVTNYGDTTYRRNRGGLTGLSGSATGMSSSASALGIGSASAGGDAIVLAGAGTNSHVNFTALITMIDFNTSQRSGDAVVSFDFVMGDSTSVTESW